MIRTRGIVHPVQRPYSTGYSSVLVIGDVISFFFFAYFEKRNRMLGARITGRRKGVSPEKRTKRERTQYRDNVLPPVVQG